MADVDTLMAQIEAVADEHTPAANYPENAYREGLSAVADHCGDGAAADLADWITNLMAESNRAPQEPPLRSEARDVCEQHGVDPDGATWLAADAADGGEERA
jgi:hypothetical protein